MTVNQMIASWEQYYDKIANLAAPGYEDSEILLFLNNAQLEFVKDRMFGNNFKEPAFEDNRKRVTDLASEVQYHTYTNASDFTVSESSYSKCRTFPIGNANPTVMYMIGIDAQVSRTYPVVTEEWTKCDFVKHDNIRNFDTTVFNKPFFTRPKYFVISGAYYIVFDAYTSGYMDTDHDLRIRYIRDSIELTAGGSCFFDVSVHQEIVDIAVREAMQVSQDKRFETKVIEGEVIKTQ